MPSLVEIESELQRLGPWISKFTVQGVSSGGWFDVFSDGRVAQWLSTIPISSRTKIIECGSLEGGHSALIAQAEGVRSVVGLEGREVNVTKCRFLHALLGINNSKFFQCNLDTENLEGYKDADAIFCSGVFYHLLHPADFFKKLKAKYIFLGTHYTKAPDTLFEGREGIFYKEHGIADSLSGMADTSFWMTLPGIQQLVIEQGYYITSLETSDQQNGPWVNLMLEKVKRFGPFTCLAEPYGYEGRFEEGYSLVISKPFNTLKLAQQFAKKNKGVIAIEEGGKIVWRKNTQKGVSDV